MRSDETFANSDFQWIEQNNEYRCPAGHALRSERRPFRNPRTHITKANTIVYRSSQLNCAGCALKDQCCPNTPIRKIARSVHESARDKARAIAKTPEYRQSRKDRKKVEILFAQLKRVMKLDRLRLRGPSGAHDEFFLAATAQNLRRMAKWLMPKQEEVKTHPHERHRGKIPRSIAIGKNAEPVDCMPKRDRACARNRVFQRNRSVYAFRIAGMIRDRSRPASGRARPRRDAHPVRKALLAQMLLKHERRHGLKH